MREIKFRGREKESNKWVFGYARHWKCCYGDEWHIQGKNDNVHIVIPETIGQFTGLLDCEGREIYEGDVVAFGDFRKAHDIENEYWHGVVKWSFEGARFVLDKLEFDEDVCNDELLVIGNVYDNPELLEAKNARD